MQTVPLSRSSEGGKVREAVGPCVDVLNDRCNPTPAAGAVFLARDELLSLTRRRPTSTADLPERRSTLRRCALCRRETRKSKSTPASQPLQSFGTSEFFFSLAVRLNSKDSDFPMVIWPTETNNWKTKGVAESALQNRPHPTHPFQGKKLEQMAGETEKGNG